MTSGGKSASVTLVNLADGAPSTPTKLVISGGWDHNSEGEVREAAKQLQAELVMAVQPYWWEYERNRHHSFVYFTAQDRFVDLFTELDGQAFGSMFYSRPKPQVSDTEWLTLVDSPGKKAIVAASKALIEAVRGKRLFCPVYGISDVGASTPASQPPPGAILFNLASTIRILQEGNVAQFRKGAVILVLCSLKSATWDITKARFGKGEVSAAASTVAPFIDGHLRPDGQSKVIVMQAGAEPDAHAISEAIANLKGDEVLILGMQGLPQDVFDLMYAEATLPPLLEGAGTAGLVISLGIPYFRFATVQYPVLPLGTQPTKTNGSLAATHATESMRTLLSNWGTDAEAIPPKGLADYISSSYSPDNSQHEYFQRFGSYLQGNPQHDKLNAALRWTFASPLLGKLK
jgi:hypothetical protein